MQITTTTYLLLLLTRLLKAKADDGSNAAAALPARDRSALVLGVSATLFGLASLSILATVASKCTKAGRRSFGLADVVAMTVYAMLVALAVSTYYSQRYGLGRDFRDDGSEEVKRFLQWHFVSRVLYYAIVSGAKVTFALAILRIWPGHTRHWFVLCCRAVILVSVAFGVSAVLTTIFECSPISVNWRTDLSQGGSCSVNCVTGSYALGSINVLLNTILFVLPVPKLLKTKSAGRGRISTVLATYLFGLLVLVSSIGRLTAVSATRATNNPTVICCCLPTIGSWLQRWRSNESSFCGVRLTGDDRPRWSLRFSVMQDQEAPYPNITPLRPSYSRQDSQGGLRSLRVRSPIWDEKSWRPSGETVDEEREVSHIAKPREHHMEAMVKYATEVKFPRRAYAPARTVEPKTPTRTMGYYFDGENYIGLQLNGKTPPTGPVTPVLFNIDEEDVHSHLRSTSDLRLDYQH